MFGINLKKLLGTVTIGGVLGTAAIYVLQHIDLSGLGVIGVAIGPIVVAIITAITHEVQTKSSTTSGQ